MCLVGLFCFSLVLYGILILVATVGFGCCIVVLFASDCCVFCCALVWLGLVVAGLFGLAQ